ncbi:hypothetical protein SNEBB_007692 [Seison nebaliae]|nr:hypothetical protein SNEBB_007692 [Seison nebaliae]
MEKVNSKPNVAYLIDVCANLCHRKFHHKKVVDKILQNSEYEGNVKEFLAPSCSLRECHDLMKLGEDYPHHVKYTVGCHPAMVMHYEKDLDFFQRELKKQYINSKCIGIGECGLDYSYEFADKKIQKEIFHKQLLLGSEMKTFMIFHEREATKDFLQMIDENGMIKNIVGLIHCFTNNENACREYIQRNMFIGLTPFIFNAFSFNRKDSRKSRETLSCLLRGYIPLNRLVVESDAPFQYRSLPAYTRMYMTSTPSSAVHYYNRLNGKNNEPIATTITLSFIIFHILLFDFLHQNGMDVQQDYNANFWKDLLTQLNINTKELLDENREFNIKTYSDEILLIEKYK